MEMCRSGGGKKTLFFVCEGEPVSVRLQKVNDGLEFSSGLFALPLNRNTLFAMTSSISQMALRIFSRILNCHFV